MELYDDQLKEIFVGRKQELANLQKKLDGIYKSNEASQVYTILNVPGIGKTKLIKHFGEAIQNKNPFPYNSKKPLVQKALFFHHTIEKDDTQKSVYTQIVEGICNAFHNMYKDESEDLPTIYSDAIKIYEETGSIKKFVEKITEGEYQNSLTHPKILLGRITNKIPIILHLDEFQRSIPENREKIPPHEQLYYQLSSFFSGILDLPIFIILTGTQYTIISTIGDNLGSPLNGKVESMVIPFLNEEDFDDFADKIIIKTINKKEEKIKQTYIKWLKLMSGGHPRTMVFMTKQFLSEFQPLTQNILEEYEDREIEKIFNKINDSTENSLRQSHLRTAAIEKLKDLINNTSISIVNSVFTHVNDRMMKGTNLGQLEIEIYNELTGDVLENSKQLNELLSKFVEVGLFSINGEKKFYISSVYAFKYFTEIFREQVPLLAAVVKDLLNESNLLSFVKDNPSVFGLFWEPIFASVLTHRLNSSLGEHNKKKTSIPKDIVDVYGELVVPQFDKSITLEQKKNIHWMNISCISKMKPRILYLLPHAKAVDAALLYNGTVFLLQIKYSPDTYYVNRGFKALLKTVKELKECKYTPIPWFIDLLGVVNPEYLENTHILYTTKEHLKEYLPKQLQ